ncbi:hypothetical protein ACI784_10860 [Geodermatophilus sp. SYSU D01186]
MPDWVTGVAAVAALVVSAITALTQYRLGLEQKALEVRQIELATRQMATPAGPPALAAEVALRWREQVLALHDRGLSPEEIRWIMCCEDGGAAYEERNGIIDEIVGNVPRVPPAGLVESRTRTKARRLPRPDGAMRATAHRRPAFEPGRLEQEVRGVPAG